MSEVESKVISKDDKWYDRLFLGAGVVFFTIILVAASAQVFTRNLRDLTGIDFVLHWTEPLARMLLVISVFWGAALASRNREHINIDLIPRLVEDRYPRARRALRLFIALCTIAFGAVLLIASLNWTIFKWDTVIPGLFTSWMPAGIMFLPISIAVAMMVIYEIMTFWSTLTESEANSDQADIEGESKE